MEISPSAIVIVAALLLPLGLFLSRKLFKKRATTSRAVQESEASSSSSSSTSSKGRVGWDHEVFLSFRGTDTRTTFTDHLYYGLKDAGIEAFIDSEDLHIGDSIGPKLIEAIRHSKISIPIFSTDFASSHWCLREVATMVDCKNNDGQFIFPIFYDVEPTNVRNQKGSYAAAFQKLEKKFPQDVVVVWKNALKEVADLSGLEVKKMFDGRQGKIVKMLVLKVLAKLRKKDLVVTDRLVGMDTHVKEIKKLLSVDRDGVRIVGIHGMGGIGKTTAAKVVYNDLLRDAAGFAYSSFLADVRENSQQHKGILNLQNQLLSDILNLNSFSITSVDHGLNMIKDKFRNKKVLIVLDDISKKSQLKELGAMHDFFGSGSRIIITTRDKDVLDVVEIDSTYEITLLNDSQSLQLFCKHAFGSDFNHPPDEYISLSKEVIASASGLPLALESIGSSLFGKGKDKWKATIKKLKSIPHDEVEKKLIVSYDGLDKGQQHIFLDIACLFNGVDKTIASYMWEACGFFPEIDIEVLLLRSLVKYGDKNELRMHDHYVSLGRKIVREEGYNNPGERSRLWNYMDALSVLENCSGTRKVEALCLNLKYVARWKCFNNEDFAELFNLRFIQFLNVDITGDFKRRFSSLIWLEWTGCPQNFKGVNFHPKNLVILDLSWSTVNERWEGWRQLEVAKNLKVLNLTGCKFLTRTPDFSHHANLERLILQDCKSLVQIDSSISHLKRLVFLNLMYCEEVKELPKEFSSMQALEELFIDGTSLREVPTSICHMKKLKTFSAKGCKNLTQVSSSIGDLESLSDLTLKITRITELPHSIGSLVNLCRLSLNRGLKILPHSIGNLESLTELEMIGAECVELPDSIGNLKNLRILNITGCSKMKKLPDSICSLENLRVLSIQGTGVGELPDAIGMLEKLEELNASSCHYLKEGLPESIARQICLKILNLARTPIESIQFISGLPNLQTLNLHRCETIQFLGELPSSLKILTLPSGLLMGTLPKFSLLINLEKLDFSNCSILVEIPRDIGELSGLKELVIEKCAQLECLPALPSGLLKLSLTSCSSMKTLKHLSNLKNLSELGVYYCSDLTEIQDLGNLELLTIFKVHGCGKFDKLDGLPQLIYLRELSIDWCDSLATFPNLSKLKMLRKLTVHYCKKLHEIDGLEALESLESLDIKWCGSLQRLPNLSNLKNLKVLELIWCDESLEIQGVEELNSLEIFTTTCWASMERVNLSNLVKLEKLGLSKCDKLLEIEGFEALRSLENLELSVFMSLERLPYLSNLINLKRLFIKSCEKLVEIQEMEKLLSLRHLEINECKALEKLPDLSKLQLLDSLKIFQCEKLYEIGSLEGLQSLRILVLSWCTSLERLPNLSNMQNLNDLWLQDCEKLTELQEIEKLKSLRHLEIKGCKALEKLPDLSKLQLLEWLALIQLENLREIWSFEGLQSLEVLDLSQCTSLVKLPNLSNLQNLGELWLHNCEKLTELQGIEELKSLHYMNIKGCKALVTLPNLSKIRRVLH